MADLKISELPASDALTGSELVEVVQGGINKRTTPQAIADLSTGVQSIVAGTNVTVDDTDPANPIVSASGGGAGTVESVTGQNNAVDNTDPANPIVRNGSREVTGASASVIGDNNGFVTFNSATPFDFTLDQLAANTKISFQNIGAGAVTFIAGSGVTITGSTTLPGAVGTNYPTAFVNYHTLTTPRVAMGGLVGVSVVPVAISTGTLTLDVNNELFRNFDLTATETGNFTIAFSNTTAWVAAQQTVTLSMRLTGTIAITMPSTTRMELYENTLGRWNTSTRVLTLVGTTASRFVLRFTPQDSIIAIEASDRLV